MHKKQNKFTYFIQIILLWLKWPHKTLIMLKQSRIVMQKKVFYLQFFYSQLHPSNVLEIYSLSYAKNPNYQLSPSSLKWYPPNLFKCSISFPYVPNPFYVTGVAGFKSHFTGEALTVLYNINFLNIFLLNATA